MPRGLDSRASITVDGVEINVEAQELVVLGELGRGAFGIVEKMKHKPSNTIMAVKVGASFSPLICYFITLLALMCEFLCNLIASCILLC